MNLNASLSFEPVDVLRVVAQELALLLEEANEVMGRGWEDVASWIELLGRDTMRCVRRGEMRKEEKGTLANS